MKKILITVCLAGLPLLSLAKLPPLNDEAKAKAAEAAAKTAWAGKVGGPAIRFPAPAARDGFPTRT